jgi:hypothetical protein
VTGAVNDEDAVVRRIGESDDVVENCQISSIPPRNIIGPDILFTASDSHEVKICFMGFLDAGGLIEKDELFDNGQGE